MSNPIMISMPQVDLETIQLHATNILNPRIPFYYKDKERGFEECILTLQDNARAILDVLNRNNSIPNPSPGFKDPYCTV